MNDEQRVRERAQALVAEHDPKSTPAQEFWGAQFDAGLAWISFPEGRGGLGVSPKLQEVSDAVLRAAGAPTNMGRNPIGVGMAAGTLLAHGRDDQIERHLRRIFTCEEVWCQLFSEPGAGSDLAGLATRAVRDGDEWVVNGQKVWTTLAHMAAFGLLVSRTDADAPKHRGLTYFILDMHAHGVDVRPLRQATGEAEFNEVYLTDVRIPDDDRLGDVGDGWRVSLTTLMNERVAIGGGIAARGTGPIGEAVRVWKERHAANGHGAATAAARDELMRLWVASEVARLTNIRAAQMRSAGTPGPEGSIGKIMAADLNKEITALTINLLGMEGTLYSSYDMVRPEEAALRGSDPHKMFLRARANSIEGGTSEIMRNILGERVLGLPGEPRVDKDLPWSKVPRS